ncbi:MAG: SDR family oxidoreductase [Gammaproteobacteria bacterium]|nr:SDR family oxidoreductase [Gammaproteobacteria bacterium]
MSAPLLDGARVLVIGGSRGIGHATAALALEHGAEVIIASRDAGRVAQARRALETAAGRAIESATVDVADRTGVAALVEASAPLDHLCLPGSQVYRNRFDELDEQAARAFFDSKFWGPFLAVYDARTRLRRGGSVVLFSGAASRRPLPGYVVGAAIDGALDALTRSLAHELAANGVRVNCISPGVVETDVTRHQRTEAEFVAWRDHHAARLPVGRIGRPEECAHAALYLMTNGFVTGEVLHVDGGLETIP